MTEADLLISIYILEASHIEFLSLDSRDRYDVQ